MNMSKYWVDDIELHRVHCSYTNVGYIMQSLRYANVMDIIIFSRS